jgi:hypothetical protein
MNKRKVKLLLDEQIDSQIEGLINKKVRRQIWKQVSFKVTLQTQNHINNQIIRFIRAQIYFLVIKQILCETRQNKLRISVK